MDAKTIIEIVKNNPLGHKATIIGQVTEGRGNVLLKTGLGGTKVLDLLAGDPLPRICWIV